MLLVGASLVLSEALGIEVIYLEAYFFRLMRTWIPGLPSTKAAPTHQFRHAPCFPRGSLECYPSILTHIGQWVYTQLIWLDKMFQHACYVA
ncbi:hypothetical protein CPB83DRAFT_571304 [Crepidotus variabilis]|uniref:Uncharacterized protein n=1 Tax=Crepidotus variabilis TaxID=179855 RepID=A0A9P6E9G7_9AGAR|nr:hypothetical protein CPB83DRAFT_571304 [Crepidotus variabilis]